MVATRYGLNAIYLRTPGGKRRPLATELDVLVNRLLPVAKDLGDERYESPASVRKKSKRVPSATANFPRERRLELLVMI